MIEQEFCVETMAMLRHGMMFSMRQNVVRLIMVKEGGEDSQQRGLGLSEINLSGRQAECVLIVVTINPN